VHLSREPSRESCLCRLRRRAHVHALCAYTYNFWTLSRACIQLPRLESTRLSTDVFVIATPAVMAACGMEQVTRL
jgi:hypothetical protein